MNYRFFVKFISLLLSAIIFPLSASKVEVILSNDANIYEEALFGFQSRIDEEIHINYLEEILAEHSSSSSFFQSLKSSDTKVIVAFGTAAARFANENPYEVPVLFGLANSPRNLIAERANSCGIGSDIPFDLVFATMKELDPKITRVGAIYSLPETETLLKSAEMFDLKHNIILTKRFSNPLEFAKELQGLEGKIDAFLMPNDPIYDEENFDILKEYAIKQKWIIFTYLPSLLRSGGSFSYSPDALKTGVMAASLSKQILLDPKFCSSRRFTPLESYSFYLNEQILTDLQIPINRSLKDRASITKQISAGILLYNEAKFKSAKTIFENLMKIDPTNELVSSYLNLCIERTEGKKTGELLAQANKLLEQENYAQAKIKFKKLLFLIPNYAPALDGYQKSTMAMSEIERVQAKSYCNQGKTKLCLQTYLASLKSYSDNQNSKIEIASIRKLEESSIPDRLKKGIESYHQRDYEKAIDSFETILLIEPANKQALEYQRLSLKKKSAIEQLEGR